MSTIPRMKLLFLLPAFLAITTHAQQRPPWTTSRIQGTPEPPPPYVVERLYPSLTFKKPLDIKPIPGADRLVVL